MNYSISPFAIANQSGLHFVACFLAKQSELQSFAVSVIVLQPHNMWRRLLALRRIALYSVEEAFTNRVWDLQGVLALIVLYLNCIDDGSSLCIEQRYSGRPIVVAAPCLTYAGIRKILGQRRV